jgi:cell division protein FtsL
MRDLTIALEKGFTDTKKKTNPKNVYFWNLALITGIVMLVLTYVFEINSLSTQGYTIKKLETRIKQLENERKQLEVQESSLRSITRIQQEAANRNFVPSNGVTYLKTDDFALK